MVFNGGEETLWSSLSGGSSWWFGKSAFIIYLSFDFECYIGTVTLRGQKPILQHFAQ